MEITARSGIRAALSFLVACLLVALPGARPAAAYEQTGDAATTESARRQYTFSWQFLDQGSMAPRGGSSRGAPVDLVTAPTADWRRLREPGMSSRERDRRAILAMAGPYRTSFDFIETVGFSEDYRPARPYQSWGTEYVYVVADEPDFISLQHIMVMRVQGDDGEISEPLVMKHWRQDWHYQARRLHTFRGDRTWAARELPDEGTAGRWLQAVYQVDDSPRYMAMGRWEHLDNYSSWTSEETWRPLPRRESSVRDDYDVLSGTNRHTITPTGWVQEEYNSKVVLDEAGHPERILARETGLARYERIAGFDWSAGDAYWQRTAPFWSVVRETWDGLFENNPQLVFNEAANDVPLFALMFQLAESTIADGFDREATRALVSSALQDYLQDR